MSDAIARPTGFVLKARYSRVDCPEPDYEGLWAEVRTNLTNGERALFLENVSELNDRIKTVFDEVFAQLRDLDARTKEATDPDAHVALTERRNEINREVDRMIAGEDDRLRAISDERLANLSPYVRAWNLCDDEGNDVPAPAMGDLTCWQYADSVIAQWLIREVEQGYRSGKGVRSSSKRLDATPAHLSGPQIVTAEAA